MPAMPRCLARFRGKLEARDWTSNSHVEFRQTDVEDEPSLTHEMEGCEAVFYLAHSMMSAGSEHAPHNLFVVWQPVFQVTGVYQDLSAQGTARGHCGG